MPSREESAAANLRQAIRDAGRRSSQVLEHGQAQAAEERGWSQNSSRHARSIVHQRHRPAFDNVAGWR